MQTCMETPVTQRCSSSGFSCSHHTQQRSATSLGTIIHLNLWKGLSLGRWHQVRMELILSQLFAKVLRITHSEIRSFFPANDEYFAYFDSGLAESCRKAVDDLDKYITLEGPFDGILAFSQGASLAATLMIQRATQKQALVPPFNCAIFFSAAVPLDYAALLHSQIKEVSSFGEVITTPTAHIWGQNDEKYCGMSDRLSKLCRQELKTEFIHSGGHEVPSSGTKDAVISAVNAIRRTITRALTAQ